MASSYFLSERCKRPYTCQPNATLRKTHRQFSQSNSNALVLQTKQMNTFLEEQHPYKVRFLQFDFIDTFKNMECFQISNKVSFKNLLLSHSHNPCQTLLCKLNDANSTGPKRVIPEDVLFKTHYGNYSRSSYSYK